jgi:ferredoxin
MIVYFSSTGNSKYIAERLADELGDTACSMLNVGKIHLKAGEKLGFVFPTYFWRLPSLVTEYMKNLIITAEDSTPYIYFIATYGTTSGQTATYMKRQLKSKGLKLSLSFGIKTVDDWTVWFDMNNSDEVKAVLDAEKPQINEAVELVKSSVYGNKMRNTLPMIAVMGSNFFYGLARRTKHLHVEDTCIGCGLCEKECPTNSIKIADGKPTWVNKKCTMCLHCLHACPRFAIQYDDKTQNHGQYMHP